MISPLCSDFSKNISTRHSTTLLVGSKCLILNIIFTSLVFSKKIYIYRPKHNLIRGRIGLLPLQRRYIPFWYPILTAGIPVGWNMSLCIHRPHRILYRQPFFLCLLRKQRFLIDDWIAFTVHSVITGQTAINKTKRLLHSFYTAQ